MVSNHKNGTGNKCFSNTIGRVSIALALGFCSTIGVSGQDLSDANPQINDVPVAFANIPTHAREIEFQRGETTFPTGGHFQGIQSVYDVGSDKQLCFITRDSATAALFITVEFPVGPKSFGTIKHLQILPSDGRRPSLRHPGGMQIIGDYLVVGVEDNQARLRSQVQFWDISNPQTPVQRKPLTVHRESTTPKDMTAGAVGIVKRSADHLLVVANWDCRALDFYLSNGFPLSDDRCRFELKTRWQNDTADKDDWRPDRGWGKYQGITLVSDSRSQIYLLGFDTDASGEDSIDLFSIDLTDNQTRTVRKLADKPMNLKGGAHFRYSGGIFVKSPNELVVYSTERDVHDTMSVSVSP